MLVLIIIIFTGIVAMSVLSHFFLNSDYTAPKEVHAYDRTLSVNGLWLNAYDSTTRSIDITVPDGVYFENTTIEFHVPGISYEVSPTSFYVFSRNVSEYEFYQIYAGIRKTSNSNYQIYATIQNVSGSGRYIPDFSVRVRCHLFVSSF